MGQEPRSREMASTFCALSHPTRVEALQALTREPQSPSEFAAESDQSLGTVSYHFRELHKAELIEVAATEQRRGALMHIYRLTGTGRRAAKGIRHFA